jgi:hypothetical protein
VLKLATSDEGQFLAGHYPERAGVSRGGGAQAGEADVAADGGGVERRDLGGHLRAACFLMGIREILEATPCGLFPNEADGGFLISFWEDACERHDRNERSRDCAAGDRTVRDCAAERGGRTREGRKVRRSFCRTKTVSYL